MKMLIEKIKPEILALIEKDYEKYPNSILQLKQYLSEVTIMADLRYGAVTELRYFYYVAFGKFPDSVWDCLMDDEYSPITKIDVINK